MIQIIQLPGTDDKLYQLVARLVMNPAVLKQNANYPFRTSEAYEWFLALEGEAEEVVGFLPVEHKRTEWVINNYYVKEKNPETLKLLIAKALEAQPEEIALKAVCFKEDMETFSQLGFETEKEWTLYVKMKKSK